MNENSKKYYGLKITSIFHLVAFSALLLVVAIINTTTLNNLFKINTIVGNWQFYSLKIFLILILVLVLVAASLWVAVSFKTDWIYAISDNYFLSFLIAFLTLNIYGCFFIIQQYQKNQALEFNASNWWTKFKSNFGIKQWRTIDYVLIAFFCALTLTFAYIEETLLPRMPFGGGVAIKYIPLIIVSFSTSFFAGWLTGFTTALMSLLFIPANNIISPWSFLLDYFLPMTTPAMIAFLPFKQGKKSIFTYVNYFLHCFLVFLTIYFWQFLSGYFLWTTVFPDSVWNGYSAVVYSLVYNFIHIFIFTYPIAQAIVPILYRSLQHYLNRSY